MRLSAVDIQSYRGLENVELDNICDLNIIVGKNNTGKTSLLEAIQLVDGRNPVRRLIEISRERESRRDRMFDSVNRFIELEYSFDYRNDDVTRNIGVSYESDRGLININVDSRKTYIDTSDINYYDRIPSRRLRDVDTEEEVEVLVGSYNYTSLDDKLDGTYELSKYYTYIYPKNDSGRMIRNTEWCRYVSPLEIYQGRFSLSHVAKNDEREEIIQLLQMFDERIVGYDKGNSRAGTVYLEIAGVDDMVPSYLFGDGIKRILALANSLYRAKNGILLIDEFEIGIHQDAMRKVALWLSNAAKKNNTQIFLTTHSAEAVKSFIEADIDESETSISAYRLERFRGSVIARHFDYCDLDRLINEIGTNIL